MATRDYTNTTSVTTATKDEFSDLDINFIAHPISGDITVKKDAEAIKRSVRNILLTNNYERPFKPNFGANLRGKLFDLQGPGATQRLISDVKTALNALEPRITNVRLKVSDNDSNNLDVAVFYTIKKSRADAGFDLKITRVR
jgi:phage baseplate assembly protein W